MRPVDESLRGKLLVASPALVDPNFFRTVVLITEQPAVLKALSLSGLDQIIRIFSSEEEYFGVEAAAR